MLLPDFGLPLGFAFGDGIGSIFISGSDLGSDFASLDRLLSIRTLFDRPLDADAGSDLGSDLGSDFVSDLASDLGSDFASLDLLLSVLTLVERVLVGLPLRFGSGWSGSGLTSSFNSSLTSSLISSFLISCFVFVGFRLFGYTFVHFNFSHFRGWGWLVYIVFLHFIWNCWIVLLYSFVGSVFNFSQP